MPEKPELRSFDSPEVQVGIEPLDAYVVVEERFVLNCEECWDELSSDEWDRADTLVNALQEGWIVKDGQPLCGDCAKGDADAEEDDDLPD